MQESFLHYIWQHQYFDKRHLTTTQGEVLHIFDPGSLNYQAGPDFSDSRIKLNGVEWMGAVEIHVLSSEWYRHQHHKDPAYQRIILHVVWEHQQVVCRMDGVPIPTLELKGRISSRLLWRYEKIHGNNLRIPCHPQIQAKHFALVEPMMHRALRQRLATKTSHVTAILERNQCDWDATTYRVLGRNFGFNINADPFEDLVKAVPLPIVRKLSPSQIQLEALFFGQAGLLIGHSSERYFRLLCHEYRYLLRKFTGLPAALPPGRWKFLRMRPANFPTLRIAQFAALMHHRRYRFSWLRELQWPADKDRLMIGCSPYWQCHYHFGKTTSWRSTGMGVSSVTGIMINSAVPLLMAYAAYLGKPVDYKPAFGLLKELPPEQNAVTRYWKAKGFPVSSAYHSQALLALNEYYCQVNKCLHCSVGISLVRP